MKISVVLPAILVAGYIGEALATLDILSRMLVREPNRCPPGDIRCGDGRCILQKWRCDGQRDCRDGSDEEHCPGPTCSHHQHLCDNRRCIPLEWRCDGRKDCDDGSDELDSNCKKACPKDFWKCPTSQMCIPIHWKCDGERDCREGEDEDKEMCSVTSRCFNKERMCADRTQCVSEKLWCDGTIDCKDSSDEKNPECSASARFTTQSPPCHGKEFRCNNGRCIPPHWICDGSNDCENAEDEASADCTKKLKTGGGYMAESESTGGTEDIAARPKCRSGDSQCLNGECIPHVWWCDGSSDCEDESDETSCKNGGAAPTSTLRSSDIPISSCNADQLFCVLHNGTTGACLPLSKWCDSHLDCLNGTDEGFECGKVCEKHGGCSHKCNPTPLGPKCTCPSGFALTVDGKTCDDVDECQQGPAGGPCSHGCVNMKGSYKCECAKGFVMEKDGHTCKTEDPSPALFYASDGQIRSVDAEGEFLHLGVLENNLTKYCNGLDVAEQTATKHQTVFVADVENGKLYWINTATHQSAVVLDNMVMPEGVAYDWTSGNLYYIDAGRPEIGVCAVRQSISHCQRIVHSSLENARSLAIHPGKRMLFFARWGEGAKIERTWLDGSGRQDVLSYKLKWPNALAVDFIWERLYYVDAYMDWLETVGYNGEDRRVVYHMKGSHPFGLTMLGNRLFWTDWNYKAINSVLTNGTDFRPVATTRRKPMGIVAVHPSRQPSFETPCSPDKNPCDQICLAMPGHLFTCLCSANYYLIQDSKCLISTGSIHQELRSSEVSYSGSSVAGIICACLLCATLLVVIVVYSRKYFLALRVDDEKSLLDYETDSPRKKVAVEPSSMGAGSENPCYENFPPSSYVVKFHKYQNFDSPDKPSCPASLSIA